MRKIENNPAIGRNALEFIDSFLTPEEIAESDARVALIGEQIEKIVANCVADLRFEGMECTEEDKAAIRRIASGQTTAAEECAAIIAKYKNAADPFYAESNIRHLRNIMDDVENGKAHFAEHELIEDEVEL